ncbi:MAG: MFS transporter [Treponema sp.]|jgi:OPA family glycerol-3-phosphate transporter-like MFS transporter|nr:MFS transporter [Treponema sp.]
MMVINNGTERNVPFPGRRFIKDSYGFWFIGGMCWLAYVTAYFGRINLSIILPNLHDTLGYSNISLGMIALCFFVAYAVGQLINGFIGDVIDPRYFVGFGLFAAGLCNVFFGFSKGIVFLCIFWSLNGYAQSMLWGPMVRMVSEATPQKQLQKITLFFASSAIFGYLFSYTLVGKMAVSLSWRMVFLIPGCILILISALWFAIFRNYHAMTGQEPVPRQGEPRRDLRDIPDFVLRNRLWMIGLIALLNGSVKEGMTLWGPSFFVDYQSLPLEKALYFMSFVPLMNLIALAGSAFMNRVFNYQAKYTISFFLFFTLAFSVLLRVGMNLNHLVVDIAFFGLFALFLAVNNMITAFMPIYFNKERRVSSVAGFLDCSVYAGAALSSPLTGFIMDKSGWKGIINGWIVICAAALLASLLSRNYQKRQQ